MAGMDSYGTISAPADADWLLGADVSESKTARLVLSVLRTFLGPIKVPISLSAHGFSVGDLVQRGSGSWTAADASTLSDALYAGMVVAVADADNFTLQLVGFVSGLSGLTDGTWYFLQDAGGLGATAGTVRCPVLIATSATTGYLVPAAPAPNLGHAADFDPTGAAASSIIVRNNSSAWQVLKNNISAAAPTTGDDDSAGYTFGSEWIDTVGGDVYKCVDPSTGAAVWKKTTP